MKKMRKGFIFMIDAILGAILLVGGVVIISKFMMSSPNLSGADSIAKDTLNVLGDLKIEEMNNPWVESKMRIGEFSPENSVIAQAINLVARGKKDDAQTLIDTAIKGVLPKNYGAEIVVKGETLYSNGDRHNSVDIASAKTPLFGKEENATTTYSVNASLAGLSKEGYSKYIPFPGYSGQGNLSLTFNILNPTVPDIKELYLTIDAEQNFTLYLNNNLCRNFTVNGNDTEPDDYNITECAGYLSTGTNTMDIIFIPLHNEDGDEDFKNQYQGGGYIRIRSSTPISIGRDAQCLNQECTLYHQKFPLIGISKSINLYDSFPAKGDVTGIQIYLHFKTDVPVQAYLNGKKILEETAGHGEDKSITLNTQDITSPPINIDLSELNNRNNRFRFFATRTQGAGGQIFIPTNKFSKIYNDSYIMINYTSVKDVAEDELMLEENLNINPEQCTASFFTPSFINKAYVVVFSGNWWNDKTILNNNVLIDITGEPSYEKEGDPSFLYAPQSLLALGAGNNLFFNLGDRGGESKGCSQNNRVILSSSLSNIQSSSPYLENAEGCVWDVEYKDSSHRTIIFPSTYSGENACAYTSSSIQYNDADAYDSAFYNLMNMIDIDSDNRIDIDISTQDISSSISSSSSQSFLPIKGYAEVAIWQ